MNWDEEEKIVTNHNIKSSTFVASFFRALPLVSLGDSSSSSQYSNLCLSLFPGQQPLRPPCIFGGQSVITTSLRFVHFVICFNWSSDEKQQKESFEFGHCYISKFFQKHPFSVVCIRLRHSTETWHKEDESGSCASWFSGPDRDRGGEGHQLKVKLEFLQPFFTVECEILSKQ